MTSALLAMRSAPCSKKHKAENSKNINRKSKIKRPNPKGGERIRRLGKN
jgi:hypothetical protein